MSFDLWIRNGHVVDPSQDWNGPGEVGIREGRIAAFGRTLEGAGSKAVYDAAGKYVSPGLIDLHGHWFEGGLYGVNAELGLNSGVTTAVDAGTCGFANFPEFRRTVMDSSAANLLGFVHVSCLGLHTPLAEELLDLRYARPLETAEVVCAHRDKAVGVKVRIGAMTGDHGCEAFDAAQAASAEARTPLMVHISQGANEAYILDRLRPGDILTHCFHGRGNRMFENGDVIPQVRRARERGVCFDIGHGCGSFSWESAQRGFEHHFYPDTISTDMHRYSIDDPFRLTLPDVMSKFFCLGMNLVDALAKTTLAPARVLGREAELGSLRPGSVGDVFVFQVNQGEFSFIDTHSVIRKGDRRIEPVATVRAGALYASGSVKRPIRPLYECDRSVFEAMGHPLERSRAASGEGVAPLRPLPL